MFRRPTRKEWTETLVLTILAVALRVERGTGTSGRTPGFMDQRFAELKDGGVHSKPDMWNDAFRTQTGQNIMTERPCAIGASSMHGENGDSQPSSPAFGLRG